MKMMISIIRKKWGPQCGYGNVSQVTRCVTSASGDDHHKVDDHDDFNDDDNDDDIYIIRSPRVKECPTCRQKITGRNMLAEKLALSLYGNWILFSILLKILNLLFDSSVTSGNVVAVKRLGSLILGNKILLYVNQKMMKSSHKIIKWLSKYHNNFWHFDDNTILINNIHDISFSLFRWFSDTRELDPWCDNNKKSNQTCSYIANIVKVLLHKCFWGHPKPF